MKKLIHIFLGIIIIVMGSFFLSITVDNELIRTIMMRIVGFVLLLTGIYYLKKVAKLGRQ